VLLVVGFILGLLLGYTFFWLTIGWKVIQAED
jgi:hypothetical protein